MATAVVPDEHRGILDKKSFGHVATIGPDGEPQSNPVWIHFDGERLRFSQTRTRQKLRNLIADPRVAVSAVDPENPYHYLEIRGVVDDIEPDEGYAFINAMSSKYLGKDTYPWLEPGEERVVVTVLPTHTTSQGG